MSNFLPGYARSFRGEAPPTANQPSLLELAAAVEQMKAGRQIEQLTGQPYRGSRSLTGTYDDLNRAQLLNELNAARSGTSSSSGKRVYGESYGGVESDEISRVNSDRNFDLALLQANEAIKANSFNRAFAQQQAATQTALQNRAMDLNALLQNGRVMAPAMRDMQDAAIRTRTAASAIPDFAAIHQSLSKAGTEFSDADTNLNETAQWIQKMVSNGMLTQDKQGNYIPGPNGLQSTAEKANTALMEAATKAQQAEARLAQIEQQARDFMRVMSGAGYVVSPEGGSVLDTKTGTKYALPRPRATQKFQYRSGKLTPVR